METIASNAERRFASVVEERDVENIADDTVSAVLEPLPIISTSPPDSQRPY